MNRFAVCLVMLTAVPFSGLAAQNDAVSYVHPLIGTQRSALGYQYLRSCGTPVASKQVPR